MAEMSSIPLTNLKSLLLRNFRITRLKMIIYIYRERKPLQPLGNLWLNSNLAYVCSENSFEVILNIGAVKWRGGGRLKVTFRLFLICSIIRNFKNSVQLLHLKNFVTTKNLKTIVSPWQLIAKMSFTSRLKLPIFFSCVFLDITHFGGMCFHSRQKYNDELRAEYYKHWCA